MDMTELVVKDNALIQASYTLDLVEQRLMLLAIMEARETGKGIAPDSLLQIHAHSYAEHFDVNKETAYTVMKDASKGLFDRYVTYHDKNPKTGKDRSFHCRWVDKIGYEKDTGIVYLRFTHDVVPLITRLEQQFTSYDIEQISSLNSDYAIRLYELLIQWRSVRKTPVFDLQQFRQQLGVEPSQYKTMSNFKKYVLDFALQQINEHTDITAKYDQHKKGRVITGFTFRFKVKAKSKKAIEANRDRDTADMFTVEGLNDKQLGRIARNPRFMADYNHLVSSTSPAGQDSRAWEFEMINRLKKDPSQFKKRPIRDYLEY